MPKSKGKSEKLSHSVWLPHSAADFGDVFHFRGGGEGGLQHLTVLAPVGRAELGRLMRRKGGGKGERGVLVSNSKRQSKVLFAPVVPLRRFQSLTCPTCLKRQSLPV